MKAVAALAAVAFTVSAWAQGPIRLPESSPAASAGQTVGITDIAISYHRPAVNKRKIWGGLVPYNVIWRAGANENTTLSFTTPVKVEGQTLPAGTYALYMIPTASQWTVIFSKFAGDWGAYNYDPSEDAARVTVTPQPMTDSQERLVYTFDDLTPSSVVASLRWEKLRVPFKIEVDVPATVRASIRNELRGGKHWSSEAYLYASRWEVSHGDPDTALQYANRALELRISSSALNAKAAALEAKGDKQGAAALRAYLNGYLTSHPGSSQTYIVYSLLGQTYAEKGDRANAKASFDKALAGARDEAERVEVYDYINGLAAEQKY